MAVFQYHPQIIEKYPAIQAGIVLGQAANQPTPEALKQAYFAEQEAVKAQIGDTPLSEIESLAAWRAGFRQFGVNPTKYRSAIEALLRRLTKAGDIPSISAMVDIGNLVSIRHRIPVAVFDMDSSNHAITVQFAAGDELFTPLFEKEAEHPEPGEVIFIDGNGLVAARRWCWRQSDQSATKPGTQLVMFVTEALHPAGETAVAQASQDIKALVETYLDGDMLTGIANARQPAFEK